MSANPTPRDWSCEPLGTVQIAAGAKKPLLTGLVAAGAVVTVQGPNGRRQMPVEAFPAGPGKTNLAPGEILVSFTLPARPAGSGDA